MRIYLCSRVAPDARPINNEVASLLRKEGHQVNVPHEAKHNNMAGSTDLEIYTQDLQEMKKADICVAVGRLGVDCAWEIGWFTGQKIPLYWYLPAPLNDRHPMLYELQCRSFNTIDALIACLKDEVGG